MKTNLKLNIIFSVLIDSMIELKVNQTFDRRKTETLIGQVVATHGDRLTLLIDPETEETREVNFDDVMGLEFEDLE